MSLLITADIHLTLTLFCCSISDSVFGADLSEELAKSHTEAPFVVVKCVEEIEKACSHHGRLTHSILCRIFSRHFEIFFYFPRKH